MTTSEPTTIDRASLIEVRDGCPGDHNFIMSCWLRGLFYGDWCWKEMKKDTFMTRYHPVLEAILAHPNVSIKVACLKEDKDVILAYSVSSGETLHWLFTKKAFRGIGLAKSLTPITTTKVSHLTKVGLSILRRYPGVEFDPFSF